VFSRNSILQEHLNVHDNKKPFQCSKCPQAFARKSDLTRHGFTHSQEQREYCQPCKKGFTRRDVYLEHMRAVHLNPEPQASNGDVRSRKEASRAKQHLSQFSRLSSPVTATWPSFARHSTLPSPARSGSAAPVGDSLPLLNHVAEQLQQDMGNGRFEGSGYWGSFTSEVHLAGPTPMASVTPRERSTTIPPDSATQSSSPGPVVSYPSVLRRSPSVVSISSTSSTPLDGASAARQDRVKSELHTELECGLCERRHTDRLQLQLHLEEHLYDLEHRPYSCEICSATFAWPAALATHKVLVRPGVRYLCADNCAFAHDPDLCRKLGHCCDEEFETHHELGHHLISTSEPCSQRRGGFETALLRELLMQRQSTLQLRLGDL
jgi:hypothetical protein